MPSIESRISIARSLPVQGTNCIGTAYFLAGLRTRTGTLELPTHERRGYFRNLVVVPRPVRGGIIAWQYHDPYHEGDDKKFTVLHMAVIRSIKPALTLAHRPEINTALKIEAFEDVDRFQRQPFGDDINLVVKFYRVARNPIKGHAKI